MKQYVKNLGKVSLTTGGAWSIDNDYEILTIVHEESSDHGYISRQDVPPGVDINNREYWMPLNVSGYADNNVIMLSYKTSEYDVKSYTLEEAVKSIAPVGRKPGVVLGFYNENTDRLDIGGRWELWQYNGVDIADWENLNNWESIYYNYNKFLGWYHTEIQLKHYHPFPEIGCYAYVGDEIRKSSVFKCDTRYEWSDTGQPVWEYIHIIIDGTVTVGPNGNWFNDGKDTGVPSAKTPVFRVTEDGWIEYSVDNDQDWKPLVSLSAITPTVEVTHEVVDAEETPAVVNEGDNFNVRLKFTVPNTPEVRVAPTITSDFGSEAKVENLGTIKKPNLQFTIPRGTQGAPGPKGDGLQIDGWVDTVDQLPSTGTIGDTYMVGTAQPYQLYMYKNDTSKFVNIGSATEIKASIFDGGRADTLYGGAREINCGGADAYLT